MKIFNSNSSEETKSLAHTLREKFAHHNLILLSGELGSGKTTFTKGLAGHLGLEEKLIKSPTYTLMREYDDFLHVDLYRLDEPDHLIIEQIDAFVSKGGLVIVEWPEIAMNLFPKPHLHITIKGEGNERTFNITEKS